jgi:hypothetical protein
MDPDILGTIRKTRDEAYSEGLPIWSRVWTPMVL